MIDVLDVWQTPNLEQAREIVAFVNKIPIEDVIYYPPVLELLSKKEFNDFRADLLPLKEALIYDEQRYVDKQIRRLSDTHLLDKMQE